MTINSATRKAGPFLGDGIATVFPFTFKVFTKNDVQVTRTDANGTETALVLDSDYSVTVNADQTVSPGGTVTYPATLATGYKLTLTGALPNLQPTSLPNNGPWYPKTVEDAEDRAVILIQQLQEKVDRSIKVNVSDTPLAPLPTAGARANMLLGFDAIGNVVVVPEPASIGAGDRTPYALVSGVDFAPGATSLALPRAPGAPGNLEVNFDALPQDFTQWSVAGQTLTIPGGVPSGVTRVWGYIGTTLSTQIPPGGSVTDSSVAAGTKLANRIAAFVDVKDFGAKGDGVSNDTAAFQSAIATGFPVYISKPSVSYYLKDAINCTTAGQMIFGAGKDVSIIKIDTGFNLSATGLFICTIANGGEGPQFSDFQVTYTQPDTAARGSLTTYPPTFYAQATQRATWTNMKVQQASNIVDLRNNPGGNNFVGCEFSWYNVAINIDGAVDSNKIDRCHFWPFAMTANQQTIFYDTNCIAINSGRCDDLHVDNCLFINGRQLVTYHSSLGDTFGNVVNSDFDTNIGIQMGSGSLNLAGCYFSCGFASAQSIIMTGGAIVASACRFAVGLALANAQVSIQGGGAIFQLSNSFFELGTADFSAVAMASNTTVMLDGCFFDHAAGISPGAAIVNCIGGLLTMTGCRASLKGGGSGILLAVSLDGYHVVTGNAFNGWTASLPVAMNNMIFDDNNGVGSGVRPYGFTSGTTDGSGHIVVTHNMGATPSAVLLNVSSAAAPFFAQADSFTTTTFRVTFWTSAGALATGTGLGFSWELKF